MTLMKMHVGLSQSVEEGRREASLALDVEVDAALLSDQQSLHKRIRQVFHLLRTAWQKNFMARTTASTPATPPTAIPHSCGMPTRPSIPAMAACRTLPGRRHRAGEGHQGNLQAEGHRPGPAAPGAIPGRTPGDARHQAGEYHDRPAQVTALF